MKTLLLTLNFLAFTTLATAQQVQERLDQQPVPVTQQQVERDAKVAQQERAKDEADSKAKLEAANKKKEEEKKAQATEADKSKKTSTTPGKQ